MILRFERADFADHRLAAFLQAHLDELEPTAPPESRHALDLSALQATGVRLWVAYIDAEIVGTGALAVLEPKHEELKSMRTDPRRRGQGIGTRILQYLLIDAAERGVARISLETGSMSFFARARALYGRSGFVTCPPFGSYIDDPNSVFMTKTL